MEDIRARILALAEGTLLDHAGWVALIQDASEEDRLFSRNFARERAQARFGKQVFFRGIIEFTNHCKNDCYYCGIRRSNQNCDRYRLSDEDILACCAEGYRLGIPVILETDARSKCDKYLHLGMKLAGTRRFGTHGLLYDLIRYPAAT